MAHGWTERTPVPSEPAQRVEGTARSAEAPNRPAPRRGARLVQFLFIVACLVGALQFFQELAAWANRVRMLTGKTEAEKREAILGDLTPFLEEAAGRIPERAAVLLVTNELPWRARYLLLPRAVYTYQGTVPESGGLGARILSQEGAQLRERGISWVLYYTRTTSGQYRIIESGILPVPQNEQAGED